jgi:hypothetical protein
LGEMCHEHLTGCSGELLAQDRFDYEGHTGTRDHLIDLKTRSGSGGRGVKTYARRHRCEGRRSCGDPQRRMKQNSEFRGTVQYSTVVQDTVV